MIECHPGDVPIIVPLLQQCFAEAGVSERFTVDECLAWVQGGLESKKTRLFVDDIGNPGAIVYLLVDSVSMFPRENQMLVILVYAVPKKRNALTFRRMNMVIGGEAAKAGKNTIYVSEWCYGDTPGIGQLWEQLGYKLQEKVYVQHI